MACLREERSQNQKAATDYCALLCALFLSIQLDFCGSEKPLCFSQKYQMMQDLLSSVLLLHVHLQFPGLQKTVAVLTVHT